MEKPVSTKNTKLAGRDGTHLLSQLFGRLRQENYMNLGGGGYCCPFKFSACASTFELGHSSCWDYRCAPPHLANFVILVETGFHHVGQVGLKLLTSNDLPTSASQGAGITVVSHRACPKPPSTSVGKAPGSGDQRRDPEPVNETWGFTVLT